MKTVMKITENDETIYEGIAYGLVLEGKDNAVKYLNELLSEKPIKKYFDYLNFLFDHFGRIRCSFYGSLITNTNHEIKITFTELNSQNNG